MRLCILAAPTLFLLSCDSPSTREADTVPREEPRKTVVFQVPGDFSETVRTLWQRSYPEDYSALVTRARESRSGKDPFAVPIEVPDSELTPETFGPLDWGRAIVPRVFDKLGYPLKGGAKAYYEPESGIFRITHSPVAIDSFRARFPEFKQIRNEQDAAEQPATAG